MATVKYNSAGVELWITRYVGIHEEVNNAVATAVGSSGNIYVSGSSAGIGIGNDMVTICYDTTGNLQWEARYDGPIGEGESINDMVLDLSENILVTGTSDAQPGPVGYEPDYATIKYDAMGNQLWVARYEGPNFSHDYATGIAYDSEGNSYVTGYSGVPPPNPDFNYRTVKYDSQGHQIWVNTYNGTGTFDDQAYAIGIDGTGNIFVTGESITYGTNYDYCTIKYSGGNPSIAGSNWQPVEALVFGAQEPVTEYQLHPCYPNPFNATTAISYELQAASVYGCTILLEGW